MAKPISKTVKFGYKLEVFKNDKWERVGSYFPVKDQAHSWLKHNSNASKYRITGIRLNKEKV